MVDQTVDFTIERPGGGVLLTVEAKNFPSESTEWAAAFQRQLFRDLRIPSSEYFLLALRDHMYLWQQPFIPATAPKFQGDTAQALAPYLSRLPYSLEKLSPSSFELLIQAWLGELVAGSLPQSEDTAWLEDSGLIESVRGAIVHANVAA